MSQHSLRGSDVASTNESVASIGDLHIIPLLQVHWSRCRDLSNVFLLCKRSLTPEMQDICRTGWCPPGTNKRICGPCLTMANLGDMEQKPVHTHLHDPSPALCNRRLFHFWREKWPFSAAHLIFDTMACFLASWRLLANASLGARFVSPAGTPSSAEPTNCSPVSSILLHDGILYFLVLMSTHIMNIYWFTRSNPELKTMTQLLSVTSSSPDSSLLYLLIPFAVVTMVCSQRIITSLNERVFESNPNPTVSCSIHFAPSQVETDWNRRHPNVCSTECDEPNDRHISIGVRTEVMVHEDDVPPIHCPYSCKKDTDLESGRVPAECSSEDVTAVIQEQIDTLEKEKRTSSLRSIV
ncbi:hypothetical protein NLI96_g3369 [Meripilus lineatus]|uniref:Uncharacterized protein n=1 Tax=Meripilus lineatus TaxID=2056292 RepID=A0AAD5V946_9APHY|nr:hypothetical protein NLI96_g3369 [Physisporinus lineatus]